MLWGGGKNMKNFLTFARWFRLVFPAPAAVIPLEQIRLDPPKNLLVESREIYEERLRSGNAQLRMAGEQERAKVNINRYREIRLAERGSGERRVIDAGKL